MLKQLLSISLVSSITIFPGTVLASSALPKANTNGDYDYTHEAIIWQVVDSDGLNCRGGPGINFAVEEVKPLGTFIEVTGGSPYISDDRKGLPWLQVKGEKTSSCFVRANRRFLQPRRERELPNIDMPMSWSSSWGAVQPDASGDYNYVERGMKAFWEVVDSDGLNCRRGPGTNFSVVEVKRSGAIVETTARSFDIERDSRGLPWLRVEAEKASSCFVRANDRFIRPTDSTSSLGNRLAYQCICHPQGTFPYSPDILPSRRSAGDISGRSCSGSITNYGARGEMGDEWYFDSTWQCKRD